MKKKAKYFLKLNDTIKLLESQKQIVPEKMSNELFDYHCHIESQIMWETRSLVFELFSQFQKNEFGIREFRSKFLDLMDAQMEVIDLMKSNSLLSFIHFKEQIHSKAGEFAISLDSLHIIVMDWDWDPDFPPVFSDQEQTTELEKKLTNVMVESLTRLQELVNDK